MNKESPKEAEIKFKEITEAYEILSNEEKRKTYDIELEEYEKQLREEKDSSNYVPLEVFMKLQEYCKGLEHSIAQLVSTPNNDYIPPYQQTNDEFDNMSKEELQLDELIYEEKKAKKAKRIELIKNIAATIIMILFLLWLFNQNNDINNIKLN